MIIKNDNVKVKKNYQGYGEQVIAKLIKSDTEHKLFFNILSDKPLQIPLISIQDELKPLYRVTKKSINYLNKLLKKYKIMIITDTKAIQKINPTIQLNEPFRCHLRTNGKPITIYHAEGNHIRYHKPERKSYHDYDSHVILGKTYPIMIIEGSK
jgi:hypothetical protein